MPKRVKITGRSSSITNSFVNSIIPVVKPTEKEVEEALAILGMSKEYFVCAYCGDKQTEWDHLRPLVKNRRPTGYISEIHNLVPSCGKCNQSKGNKNWKDWMRSDALLSPTTKRTRDIDEKIRRLEAYENWGNACLMDFGTVVGKELWNAHWMNCDKLQDALKDAQETANAISSRIAMAHGEM